MGSPGAITRRTVSGTGLFDGSAGKNVEAEHEHRAHHDRETAEHGEQTNQPAPPPPGRVVEDGRVGHRVTLSSGMGLDARDSGFIDRSIAHSFRMSGHVGSELAVNEHPMQPSAPVKRDWRGFVRDEGALAFILMAAASLHWTVLRAPFFADDFLFLDQVRNRSLLGAVLSPDPIGNFMRPLSRQVYFWCLSRLGAEQPLVFHVAGLLLFLCAIALLHSIARRHIGGLGAAIASAIFALHYAADVPLLWASGAQDLLALVFSLAAIDLYARGRSTWAALACFLALWCKETAIVTPLLAVIADPRPADGNRIRLRRAIPLALATAAWAALWFIARRAHGGAGQVVRPDLSSALAALAHLFQVTFGLERGIAAWWSQLPPLPLVALVLAAAGIMTVAWNSAAASSVECEACARSEATRGASPAAGAEEQVGGRRFGSERERCEDNARFEKLADHATRARSRVGDRRCAADRGGREHLERVLLPARDLRHVDRDRRTVCASAASDRGRDRDRDRHVIGGSAIAR